MLRKRSTKRATVPAAAPAPFVLNGDGFRAESDGDILTITVDLSQELRLAETGKTMIIAQSERFQQLRTPGEWLHRFVASNAICASASS
jgi:hypothetical protein